MVLTAVCTGNKNWRIVWFNAALWKCSKTPLIRINWDAESSGYVENPDNWILSLKIGYIGKK